MSFDLMFHENIAHLIFQYLDPYELYRNCLQVNHQWHQYIKSCDLLWINLYFEYYQRYFQTQNKIMVDSYLSNEKEKEYRLHHICRMSSEISLFDLNENSISLCNINHLKVWILYHRSSKIPMSLELYRKRQFELSKIELYYCSEYVKGYVDNDVGYVDIQWSPNDSQEFIVGHQYGVINLHKLTTTSTRTTAMTTCNNVDIQLLKTFQETSINDYQMNLRQCSFSPDGQYIISTFLDPIEERSTRDYDTMIGLNFLWSVHDQQLVKIFNSCPWTVGIQWIDNEHFIVPTDYSFNGSHLRNSQIMVLTKFNVSNERRSSCQSTNGPFEVHKRYLRSLGIAQPMIDYMLVDKRIDFLTIKKKNINSILINKRNAVILQKISRVSHYNEYSSVSRIFMRFDKNLQLSPPITTTAMTNLFEKNNMLNIINQNSNQIRSLIVGRRRPIVCWTSGMTTNFIDQIHIHHCNSITKLNFFNQQILHNRNGSGNELKNTFVPSKTRYTYGIYGKTGYLWHHPFSERSDIDNRQTNNNNNNDEYDIIDILQEHGCIISVALCPSEEYLVTVVRPYKPSASVLVLRDLMEIHVWSLSTWMIITRIHAKSVNNVPIAQSKEDDVHYITIDVSDEHIITGDEYGRIYVYDLLSGKQLSFIDASSHMPSISSVRRISINPSNPSIFAVIFTNGMVNIFGPSISRSKGKTNITNKRVNDHCIVTEKNNNGHEYIEGVKEGKSEERERGKKKILKK